MPGVAAVSQILGSIDGEIRAATSCDAVGFVVPSTNGMLRFEARNELMASAAYVRTADMPDQLHLPIEAPRRVTPIPSLRAESPSERFLTVFELKSLCAVPLDVDGGGLMWIANRTWSGESSSPARAISCRANASSRCTSSSGIGAVRMKRHGLE